MRNEKISVITVCYNSVKTIEQTILSVLNQSNHNYEYIVIDGKSNDGTIDIIHKYEKNINYFISEPDEGIYDAMNKGIQVASGDIIAFLNSDDLYYEYTIERVLSEFESGIYDIVCGDVIAQTKDNIPVYRKGEVGEVIYYKMPVCHQAVFAQAVVFSQIGIFDLQYKIAADYDWLLKAYINGSKIKYINEPLASFCCGGFSSQERMTRINEFRDISLKLLPRAKGKEYLPIISEYYEESKKKYILSEKAEWLLEYKIQLFRELLDKYIKLNEDVYIWGSGIRGSECIKWMNAVGVNVIAVVDMDNNKWGCMFNNVEIKKVEILKEERHKVIITPKYHELEICQKLEEFGYMKELDYVLFSDMMECIYNQKK